MGGVRVAYLAAGAAGMYCGSCMRDNRLAATLIDHGREVLLVPLYTPLRTDEQDVSDRQIMYGGINVYLQQKLGLFRHTPRALDSMFDRPKLLNGVGRFASTTSPAALGALTVSVLKGEHGHQRKELGRLIKSLKEWQPDIVNLPNLMFIGVARRLREALGVTVLCTLSGEDIFLDQLPEPFRAESFSLIAESGREVDGFIAVTEYFAEHASRHFKLGRNRIHVVPMGIHADDFADQTRRASRQRRIGYFARICPEKGLHELAEAFVELRRRGHDCVLEAAGYLGPADKPYLEGVMMLLAKHGQQDRFQYHGEVSRSDKIRLLRSWDIFSVPTVYREAKGFYIMEAMASGTPVVQPRHGSFPELIEATDGGMLYDPSVVTALPDCIERLIKDEKLRRQLARHGQRAVCESFTSSLMAKRTWALYQRFWSAAQV